MIKCKYCNGKFIPIDELNICHYCYVNVYSKEQEWDIAVNIMGIGIFAVGEGANTPTHEFVLVKTIIHTGGYYEWRN